MKNGIKMLTFPWYNGSMVESCGKTEEKRSGKKFAPEILELAEELLED